MRAFHHPDSRLHLPLHRIAGGELRPTVETPARVDLLLEGLSAASLSVEVPEPDDAALQSLLRRVHDVAYLDFLSSGYAEWRALPGTGPEVRTSVHTSRHMTRLPEDFIGRAGYYQADSSCVLVKDTWRSALAAAATSLAATRVALANGCTTYALCRPPGHHAFTDQAGGFCYLNNAAVAASAAAGQGARVAILDVDVHHGNGTQQIFYGREDVLTISLHGDTAWLYPYYTGYADEIGIGAGVGKNGNMPLPLHSGWEVYRPAMETARARIEDHGTDFLVVSLGLDACRDDPFACMGLSVEDFERLGSACRLSLPTVLVQEGGYPSPALARSLTSFLKGIAA